MSASGNGRSPYPNTGWWTRLNKNSRSKAKVLRLPIWNDYFFGATGRTGTFSGTESADVFVASGTVTGGVSGITGNFAATEAGDLAVLLGDVFVKGTFTKTEVNDSVVASGKVAIKGTFNRTDVNDSWTAAGKVLVTGTLTATEPNDVGVWAGGSSIQGTLAANEELLDAFSGIGTVVSGAISGTLTSTEPADTFDARSSTPSVNAVGGTVLRHRSWSALKRWAREEEEVAAALQLLEEAASNPLIALSDEFDKQVDKAITVIKLAVALSLKQADDAKRTDLENLRQQIEIKRMELRAKAAREELEELLLLAF